MKNILLTILVISGINSATLANECPEGQRYTTLAKKIFVEETCSRFKLPEYYSTTFNGVYNEMESIQKKYCENTPEVICATELKSDIDTAISKALKDEDGAQELFKLFNIKKVVNSVLEFSQRQGLYPSIFLNFSMSLDDTYVLSYPSLNADGTVKNNYHEVSFENIKRCNSNLEFNEDLTCLGKFNYLLNAYGTLKWVETSTSLALTSYCLKRKSEQLERGEDIGATSNSFGPCDGDLKLLY